MRNNREPREVDGLLNALLADANWHALNGSLKRDALAAIGVTRRRRRLRLWLRPASCAALLLAGAAWWLRPSTPEDVPVAGTSGQPVSYPFPVKLGGIFSGTSSPPALSSTPSGGEGAHRAGEEVPFSQSTASPWDLVSAHMAEKFMSEEEMLATFPAGSCVVAEINGQKTLVFFDAKQAEEGFAWSGE